MLTLGEFAPYDPGRENAQSKQAAPYRHRKEEWVGSRAG
jgi:hypothetical protein